MASIIDDCKQEMEQTVVTFKRDLSRLRTSRATTALLDGISVEYYGARTPLNQLASLSAPEPRLLDHSAVRPHRHLRHRARHLPVRPRPDARERRQDHPHSDSRAHRGAPARSRQARAKMAEEFRVSVRAHRRDAIEMMKELHKEKDLTDDDLKKSQERVEQLTKEYVERVDKQLKLKEDEIMAI